MTACDPTSDHDIKPSGALVVNGAFGSKGGLSLTGMIHRAAGDTRGRSGRRQAASRLSHLAQHLPLIRAPIDRRTLSGRGLRRTASPAPSAQARRDTPGGSLRSRAMLRRATAHARY